VSGRKPGAKQKLLNDFAALDYCEATPADNQNILILITDTPDEESAYSLISAKEISR
jgi:hypothetical protein